MAEVISLDAHRPHYEGPVRCLDCKHEWQAVAPVGTLWLECPSCSLLRGRFIWPVQRQEILHLICGCGNDLFHLTEYGPYCPNCGDWKTGGAA